jgi:hypothetical protein
VILAADGTNRLAGPAALVVILLLLVATAFLIRNMDGRLRRLPKEFPEQPPRGREKDTAAPEE